MSCSTCQLNTFSCPGHVGHIELPVPVYHPIFMDQLLRLLRSKCIYCHHLRISRLEVNRYYCKLRLIQHGLIKEAMEIENIRSAFKSVADLKESQENSNSESDEDSDKIIRKRLTFVRHSIKRAKENRWKFNKEKNEAIAEERHYVIKEFLTVITKGRKCQNCQGYVQRN